MNDDSGALVEHLVELCQELDKDDISIVLGGGMSLYLRLKFTTARTPRYPFDPPVRSTADLDVFLSSHAIADRKVEIKVPRIKPVGVDGIHAYLTVEAAGIEIGKKPVVLERLAPGVSLKNQVLFLPSSYNYLILKLHAFEDRKNDAGPKSNFGRHHAFDLFATVARMGEADWNNAKEHLALHQGEPYMKKAVEIRRVGFASRTGLGVLRLRESESYQRDRPTYDGFLQAFMEDLAELFPG